MHWGRDMEKFLHLKTGMHISEVENVLNIKLEIEQIREKHFKTDQVHFKNYGVWLFFKPETQILDTIRFEDPFSLEIDGVKIGDTKKQVKQLKGKPPRVDPFPDQDESIWIYGKLPDPDWIRFDFERTRNGKCIRVFR